MKNIDFPAILTKPLHLNYYILTKVCIINIVRNTYNILGYLLGGYFNEKWQLVGTTVLALQYY